MFLETVPANWLRKKDSGCQRFLAEDISYEHEYNSRLDPNYPTRGKVRSLVSYLMQYNRLQYKPTQQEYDTKVSVAVNDRDRIQSTKVTVAVA